MPFRIVPLSLETFAPLFSLSDEALLAQNIVRTVADRKPGFPCRVSLTDAEVGDTVLLLNHEHQPAPTPFRASHAIYVKQGASEARCAVGEVPALFRCRTLSLRGFDAHHMLVRASLAHGAELEAALEQLFDDARVSYVHLHYAAAGCYAARAERVVPDSSLAITPL
ncbi:MAG: DUF1203 domain-containing protein [Gammaproteobacteria bacterium]|nr:DUF1203 domain-containing protein [Gammaproteobacteria bacterium]